MPKTSLSRILIPVSHPDTPEAATRFFYDLASGLDGSVTMLSVVEPESLSEDEQAAIRTDTGIGQVERSYREFLARSAGSVGYENAEVEAVVSFGQPAAEIIRHAESGFDLITMLTHARGLIQRGFLGSVTDEVIRGSSVPVITAAPSSFGHLSERLETLIVTLDGSTLAERALDPACELAAKLDLKMILVRAAHYPGSHTPVSSVFAEVAHDLDVEEMSDQRLRPYLDDIARDLSARGLTVEMRILRGNPTHHIVELAQGTSGSMVVMTTHGHSGFRRLVVGSVTDHVVRYSGRPVMVIPPSRQQ